MNWLITITCVAAISFCSLAHSASEMESNAGSQQDNLPRNGQAMETVRNQYGQPRREIPAVGEPPITRWVYSDFTVYFEHDKVIHAVVHRQS